jgi:hypothetical protein
VTVVTKRKVLHGDETTNNKKVPSHSTQRRLQNYPPSEDQPFKVFRRAIQSASENQLA